MNDENRQIVRREMMLDLNYRLRLADGLFFAAAETLVSAAALEDWNGRCETLRRIGAYGRALRTIARDLSLVSKGRQTVFPPELAPWIFEGSDGDIAAQLQLKRLRVIAEGMELAVDGELLQMELRHE